MQDWNEMIGDRSVNGACVVVEAWRGVQDWNEMIGDCYSLARVLSRTRLAATTHRGKSAAGSREIKTRTVVTAGRGVEVDRYLDTAIGGNRGLARVDREGDFVTCVCQAARGRGIGRGEEGAKGKTNSRLPLACS